MLSIGADEIRIAKLADSLGAIFFASAPQIAARKPAEHCRRAGIRAFALKRVKDFFDGIHVAIPTVRAAQVKSRGAMDAKHRTLHCKPE